MKLAVIGANGKAGRLIVAEAVARGFDVTAVVRNENHSSAQNILKKDLFDLTNADLAGFDVVIDAFAAWTPETLPQHSSSLAHLCDILAGTNVRLLVVGGAGSLYIDDSLTVQLVDTPDFPVEYKSLAQAMAKALMELRKRDDVKWTYISPAAVFDPEGKKTGHYRLAGEIFTLNEQGESYVSYADYAIAMIDEAVKGEHIRQRISVFS
ncbi:NAD(P)-dependent oxidoreductase [Avibacterium sp. 20-129]|uniref:NAD(P)-dependent oxidoreductase n=1 Tax=Avibacterium sp. 20-129 TaxID=2911525 RepID=UPI002247A563|nr:NAD(P)-dependent oxidoreductase [Avibacterium sp. 20-129]MCW9697865.1 NAD(P)-dependent oxidoreductase [Avibacterium sp. 20-129]